MTKIIVILKNEIRLILKEKKILGIKYLFSFLGSIIMVYFSFGQLFGFSSDYNFYTIDGKIEEVHIVSDEASINVSPKTVTNANDFSELIDDEVFVSVETKQIFYNGSNPKSVSAAHFGKHFFQRLTFVQNYPEAEEYLTNVKATDISGGIGWMSRLIYYLIPIVFFPLIFSSISERISRSVLIEKENGTFARLILGNVGTGRIIAAKLLTGIVQGLFDIVMNIFFVIFGICLLKWFNLIEVSMEIDLTFQQAVLILICILLYSILFSGIALGVCLSAKTYAEAGRRNSIVSIIVVFFSCLSALNLSSLEKVGYFIPCYNITAMLIDMANGLISTEKICICAFSIILLSAIEMVFCCKRINEERFVC